jgi:hypothetical protein
MRTMLLIFLMATPAFSQSSTAGSAVAPGCGTVDTKFEVKPDKGQDAAAQASDGKALVYFIEDDSQFGSIAKPTTRAGVDGEWVGATHGNSYIYFSVDPGVHHLCANWQAELMVTLGRQVAAAHFTAEPGGVYYFRVRNTGAERGSCNRFGAVGQRRGPTPGAQVFVGDFTSQEVKVEGAGAAASGHVNERIALKPLRLGRPTGLRGSFRK